MLNDDLIIDIFAYVLLGVIILLAISYCLFIFYQSYRTQIERKKYILSLDEHDKAVISGYLATHYEIKGRKNAK